MANGSLPNSSLPVYKKNRKIKLKYGSNRASINYVTPSLSLTQRNLWKPPIKKQTHILWSSFIVEWISSTFSEWIASSGFSKSIVKVTK